MGGGFSTVPFIETPTHFINYCGCNLLYWIQLVMLAAIMDRIVGNLAVYLVITIYNVV